MRPNLIDSVSLFKIIVHIYTTNVCNSVATAEQVVYSKLSTFEYMARICGNHIIIPWVTKNVTIGNMQHNIKFQRCGDTIRGLVWAHISDIADPKDDIVLKLVPVDSKGRISVTGKH